MLQGRIGHQQAATNRDTISDFSAGSDTIRLDHDVFTALAVGVLAADAFLASAGATSAQDASDRIVYNTTTGALYYDADGTGGVAAVAFAVLGTMTHPAITAADFVIVA